MAFVRWRGRCAQLLATVYEGGRSKQVTLTTLTDFYVPESVKQDVKQKFPNIHVDWVAITRSLAEGPPDILKNKKTPAEHLDMAVVEDNLRKWAREAKAENEADHLRAAATVLKEWRARFYYEQDPWKKRDTP